jgi:hypothetical protein
MLYIRQGDIQLDNASETAEYITRPLKLDRFQAGRIAVNILVLHNPNNTASRIPWEVGAAEVLAGDAVETSALEVLKSEVAVAVVAV